MDRGRGRRYDDRGGGGGYGGYRGGRSPRREERPRSRSRQRSPKGYDRRDRPRSPPRDYERPPRSPYRRRSRSPYGRDRSPGRPRSDIPPYRPRSPVRGGGRYSDDRHERRDYPSRDAPRRFPMENNYRPGEQRARSPPRRSREDSPRSQPHSRRASPPPERARSPPPARDYGESRNDRGYYGREPSPPRRARSPPRETASYRDRSPPPVRAESYRERSPFPAPLDDGYLPDANYEKEAPAYGRDGPPTGPAYRGEVAPIEAREVREPRASRSDYRESSRGGRYGGGGSYRDDAPSGPRSGGRPPYDSAPHSGRWPSQDQSQGRYEGRGTAPAFRGSSNSTSTTYPRTQRFNNHLAGVPSVVDGGKKQPSLMDPEHEKKLQQLEEEKRKLEAAIEEKQRKKRLDLREWDKLEREAKSSQLRSELAEGHLERLSSEIGTGSTY